jgi:hypothetical protein
VVRLLSATSSKRSVFSNKKRKKSKCQPTPTQRTALNRLLGSSTQPLHYPCGDLPTRWSARVNEAVTKEEEKKKKKRKSFLNPLISHKRTDLATLMREESTFCEPKRRRMRDQPTNDQPDLAPTFWARSG